MKITGNGITRQDVQNTLQKEKNAPASTTFDALLGDRVARAMPAASERAPLFSDTGRLPIFSTQGTQVLDQGEIRFFENMLHAGSPMAAGGRHSVSQHLQAALQLNRPA